MKINFTQEEVATIVESYVKKNFGFGLSADYEVISPEYIGQDTVVVITERNSKELKALRPLADGETMEGVV